MASSDPARTRLHAERLKIANAKRLGSPEDVEDARRDYYTKQAVAALEEILARAPELTPEQLGLIRSVIPAPSVDQEGAA